MKPSNLFGLILAASIGLAGCRPAGQPFQPVFVITEVKRTEGPTFDAAQIITSLASGSMSFSDPLIGDLLNTGCVHPVNVPSAQPRVVLDFFGDPSQGAFNAQLKALSLPALAGGVRPCPAGDRPQEVVVQPDQNVVVGQWKPTTMTVLQGGKTYRNDLGFARFRISAYNASTKIASGEFNAVLRDKDATANVLFVVGSFNLVVTTH